MALHDQRAARLLARIMRADDDRRRRMQLVPRAGAGMRCKCCAVHLEALHLVAARLHGAEHEVLHRVLIAARGDVADHVLRELDLGIEALVDGGDDVVAEFGIEGHGESFRLSFASRI
jgi:hypothetical protein